jgi:hypothetical protein
LPEGCVVQKYAVDTTLPVCRDCFVKQLYMWFYMQCWLDNEKLIAKQTKDYNFKFAVKFYTPDPELLEEEYSR